MNNFNYRSKIDWIHSNMNKGFVAPIRRTRGGKERIRYLSLSVPRIWAFSFLVGPSDSPWFASLIYYFCFPRFRPPSAPWQSSSKKHWVRCLCHVIYDLEHTSLPQLWPCYSHFPVNSWREGILEFAIAPMKSSPLLYRKEWVCLYIGNDK